MKKYRIFLQLILFVTAILTLITCDKSSTKPDDEVKFKGVTETNADGEIISEDPDDWYWDDLGEPGMIPQKYQIQPAFPNPTYNIPIIIRFQLPKRSYVQLNIVNEKMEIISPLTTGLHQAGLFQIRWDLKDTLDNRVPPGRYRCYFDVQDTIITGDILIKDYLKIKNTDYSDFAEDHYDIAKWTSWYESLPLDEQFTVNYFTAMPIPKDETFYELIGKASGFVVGWDDVPAILSIEKVYDYESIRKNEYISLWNNAHVK